MNQSNLPAQQNSVIALLNKSKTQIQAALPKHMNSDRISRIALTAIRLNPKLGLCTPESFMAALMQSSALGLEPNTPLGQAYLIPYKTECSFQIGYKGLLDLAYRSGKYKMIYAMEVYSNDKFVVKLGLNMDLIHEPADEAIGDPIKYYGVYQLLNGGYNLVVWSRDKIENHMKKYAQSYNSSYSPWKTNFDAMAKKTVLKDLLKTAPLSAEMATASSHDGLVLDAKIENGNMVIDQHSVELIADTKIDIDPPSGPSKDQFESQYKTKEELINKEKKDRKEAPKEDKEKVKQKSKKGKKEDKKSEKPVDSDPVDTFINDIGESEENQAVFEQGRPKEAQKVYELIDKFLNHSQVNQEVKDILVLFKDRIMSPNDMEMISDVVRDGQNGNLKPISDLLMKRDLIM